MSPISKEDIIENISDTYDDWVSFYSSVIGDLKADVMRKIDGWFICFEGYEVNDMYLQREDPRGDSTGDIVTCKDVFKG